MNFWFFPNCAKHNRFDETFYDIWVSALIVCILVKIFLKIKEKINFSVENTREYQEVEPQSMEVDSETAPAIEALIQKYPEYMKVEDLPIEQLDTKMKVVQDLWEKKLLLTKEPLEAHYDD